MCLYAVNRFWLKELVTLPVAGYFLRCHFNDMIGGVTFCALINVILWHSQYRQYRITGVVPAAMIMGVVGVLWEYVLPLLYPRGTADPLDIAAYMTGGILYSLLCRSKTTKKTKAQLK